MRLIPDKRRAAILIAAVQVATEGRWATLTRAEVAEAAGCSPALVTRYFPEGGAVDCLRAQIMLIAGEQRILPIVAQGLAVNDPVALSFPLELRRAAAEGLVSDD